MEIRQAVCLHSAVGKLVQHRLTLYKRIKGRKKKKENYRNTCSPFSPMCANSLDELLDHSSISGDSPLPPERVPPTSLLGSAHPLAGLGWEPCWQRLHHSRGRNPLPWMFWSPLGWPTCLSFPVCMNAFLFGSFLVFFVIILRKSQDIKTPLPVGSYWAQIGRFLGTAVCCLPWKRNLARRRPRGTRHAQDRREALPSALQTLQKSLSLAGSWICTVPHVWGGRGKYWRCSCQHHRWTAPAKSLCTAHSYWLHKKDTQLILNTWISQQNPSNLWGTKGLVWFALSSLPDPKYNKRSIIILHRGDITKHLPEIEASILHLVGKQA